MDGIDEISATLVPYALNKALVGGSKSPKSAPSLRAVLCNTPSSASDFLFLEMVFPKAVYSAGASTFCKVKSKLKFAKDAEFSLCTVAIAAANWTGHFL